MILSCLHLFDLQESLNQIETHLKQLESDYIKSVSEHNELKERKLLTARRLERATQLIHALRDEEVDLLTDLNSSLHL